MTKCPICQKPVDPVYKPFCSKRCADVDLGKWFTESYTIAAVDDDEAEEPDLEDGEE